MRVHAVRVVPAMRAVLALQAVLTKPMMLAQNMSVPPQQLGNNYVQHGTPPLRTTPPEEPCLADGGLTLKTTCYVAKLQGSSRAIGWKTGTDRRTRTRHKQPQTHTQTRLTDKQARQ